MAKIYCISSAIACKYLLQNVHAQIHELWIINQNATPTAIDIFAYMTL